MYGVCNTNGFTDQNCPYDGPGITLNDTEAEEILLRRCPDFFSDPSTPVCCAPDQVRTLENSIQMAEGIFGRCQTCLKNLMKGICGVACDPDQDKYLEILELRNSSVFRDKVYVNRLEYRMDEQYMQSVYDTCKQVIHPSSGRLAMELACGTEASKCTPEQLYFYMGDPGANPLVPFKIEYVMSENASIRFSSETKECHEAYEDSYACSCVDCAESCPISEPPTPDSLGFLIFNLNGTTFIIAIVIGCLGLVALILGSLSGDYGLSDLPKFLGGFDAVDDVLVRFFRWWGRRE
jgi:Niemann-Pick C1 protein